MQDSASSSTSLLALALVAGRVGMELNAETLRRSYVISEAEPTTAALLAIARDVGLDARCINPKWHELPKLQRVLPAILRLRDGGALLLESVLTDTPSGQVVIVRDPTGGEDAKIALDRKSVV